jgi:hypothetical protein
MGSLKIATSQISAVPLNGAWDERHCQDCPWMEWNVELDRCNNRGEFICQLYLTEVFSPRQA